MKTATLPAVRVAPQVRELVESVLKEGESLSTFIEEAAKIHAQWRKEDQAFYTEAARRSALLKAGKMKTITAEESIRRLRNQIEKKKAAQLQKAA